MSAVCIASVCCLGFAAATPATGFLNQDSLLEKAEERVRAIYERGEFRARGFRADWLADSSGYTRFEPVPGTKDTVLVKYGTASSRRTVMNSPLDRERKRSTDVSPDGSHRIHFDHGNLFVREVEGGESIQITKGGGGELDPQSPSGVEPRWDTNRLRANRLFSGEAEVRPRSRRSELSRCERRSIRPSGRGDPFAPRRRCQLQGRRDELDRYSSTRRRLLPGASRVGREFSRAPRRDDEPIPGRT